MSGFCHDRKTALKTSDWFSMFFKLPDRFRSASPLLERDLLKTLTKN